MLALRQHSVMLRNRASELAQAVRLATAEIHERERETVTRLAKAAEFRDPETGAHILRMAHFSRLIGKHLGLESEDLDMLFAAAPMHDVGKLGTPDHILLKPGRLSPKEFEIMKEHASIGYEILKDSSSPVVRLGAEIALTHHERFDGKGYPRGLFGEAIPLVGRIVAVADVFDALTSERPYKPAWDIKDACDYLLRGRAHHFDARCVDIFLDHWNESAADPREVFGLSREFTEHCSEPLNEGGNSQSTALRRLSRSAVQSRPEGGGSFSFRSRCAFPAQRAWCGADPRRGPCRKRTGPYSSRGRRSAPAPVRRRSGRCRPRSCADLPSCR